MHTEYVNWKGTFISAILSQSSRNIWVCFCLSPEEKKTTLKGGWEYASGAGSCLVYRECLHPPSLGCLFVACYTHMLDSSLKIGKNIIVSQILLTKNVWNIVVIGKNVRGNDDMCIKKGLLKKISMLISFPNRIIKWIFFGITH